MRGWCLVSAWNITRSASSSSPWCYDAWLAGLWLISTPPQLGGPPHNTAHWHYKPGDKEPISGFKNSKILKAARQYVLCGQASQFHVYVYHVFCLFSLVSKFLILKALIDIFNKERPYCGVCLQLLWTRASVSPLCTALGSQLQLSSPCDAI